MPDSTQDRVLYLLKSAGPQTAAALAARLAISAAAVRQHLDALAASGLVAGSDQRQGIGRPKRHWQLTAAGHARFPDSHAGLTLELLQSTRGVFGEDGLERLIAHREAAMLAQYRARLAGCPTLGEKLAALAGLRDDEGYMAACVAEADGGYTFVENHCPICAAAQACQGLCRSELAIFTTLLDGAATVSRLDHIAAGARRCAYRIIPTGR